MKYSTLILIGVILVSAAAYGLYWRDHRYAEPATIAPATSGTATAYFAGGCFWCTEADFEKIPGVSEVISGYSGGTTTDPDYVSVSAQTTGHRETVAVRYDPGVVSYETLVRFFFAHIDPTDPNGQFADQGDSYRSAVFTQTEREQLAVIAEITRLGDAGAYPKPIVTPVLPFTNFYPAEEYHQDYWKKNPVRYRYYRNGSGRDRYLEQACVWRQAKNLSCESTETKKNH
jgi:methionine-S-sulfoxide reductase